MIAVLGRPEEASHFGNTLEKKGKEIMQYHPPRGRP